MRSPCRQTRVQRSVPISTSATDGSLVSFTLHRRRRLSTVAGSITVAVGFSLPAQMKYLPSGLALTPLRILAPAHMPVNAVFGSVFDAFGAIHHRHFRIADSLEFAVFHCLLDAGDVEKHAGIFLGRHHVFVLTPISVLYWFDAASLPSNDVATKSMLPSTRHCQRTSMVSASRQENSERYLLGSSASVPSFGSGMLNSDSRTRGRCG